MLRLPFAKHKGLVVNNYQLISTIFYVSLGACIYCHGWYVQVRVCTSSTCGSNFTKESSHGRATLWFQRRHPLEIQILHSGTPCTPHLPRHLSKAGLKGPTPGESWRCFVWSCRNRDGHLGNPIFFGAGWSPTSWFIQTRPTVDISWYIMIYCIIIIHHRNPS